MVEYVYSILEIIIVIFGILSLIPVFASWKDTKNRMYIAIFVLTLGLIAFSIINLLTYLFEIDTTVYLIGGLRFGYILGYILATIQLEFMLYLRDLKKLYTVPFIIAFYLIMGNILIVSSLAFILYLTFVAYVPAYFLLRDGKSKRNGLAFGTGLLFLIWGIGQTIPLLLITIIFRTVAVFFFFLGTRGFYENYIFLDQQEEQKILGTWISKFVVKE
ncbi:MAG: hypothetical protein ACFFD5_00870 [Candidatus Thorarchaeota archaeon]